MFDIDIDFDRPFDLACFRASSLAHVNAMLREQLDQATSANQQLTSDIHKLTQDWQRAREELEQKENEWRDEEQVGYCPVSQSNSQSINQSVKQSVNQSINP